MMRRIIYKVRAGIIKRNKYLYLWRNKKVLEEEKVMYMKVRNTQVSQNALFAAEDYLKVISPLCPKYANIAHSLLRIAVRPLSYMGCSESPEMYSAIATMVKDNSEFIAWLNEHVDLLELCAKELVITYILSELRYFPSLNQVQLNFVRDEEVAGITPYYDVITKYLPKISMSFSDFQEFRIFASTFFEKLNISQEEIDLILSEENFEKEFELLTKNKHS
jgi:hypothetical protein